MLKNAKTEFTNEHEEIATYTGIEALAEAVGDRDTAKLARGIRREEERMAGFLEKQIPRARQERGPRGDPGRRAQQRASAFHAATARRAPAPARTRSPFLHDRPTRRAASSGGCKAACRRVRTA